MPMTYPRARGVGKALLAISLLSFGACNLSFSNQAEARDQWTRHYTLTQGGTLEIRNTNGKIDVEPTDGTAVDVVADRTVRAPTDEAAKDALTKFAIAETVSPDRIVIDSSNRGAGFFLNLSRQVDYQIRVPRWANVTLSATNGDIRVTGLRGVFRADTTNGRVRASALENSATVTATNGAITLDFATIGAEGISCETTNGAISVTLPREAKAQLSARVTNGSISTEGIDVAISEQSRRRLDGSIGGGGPNIRLETTNGQITLKGK